MKREIKYLIVFLIIYIPYLLLTHPLNKLLTNSGISELKSQFIAPILILIPLLITLVWLVKKFNFRKFNGIERGTKLKRATALFIPLIFLVFVFFKNFSSIINSDISELLLFVISVFLVGFSEELFFRGILLPLFITKLKENKHFLVLSVFLSSLVFGLIHFLNLVHNPSNISGIIFQVIFAFCIGFLFSGFILRTNSIIIPSLIHAIVNFKGQISLLNHKNPVKISEQNLDKLPDGIIWDIFTQELPTLILILLGAYILIRKIDKNEILQILNIRSTTAKSS